MSFTERDVNFMQEALALANFANAKNEVPVGAILVWENQIIGRGWNHPIAKHDPTAHAEVTALRQAAQQAQNYRLVESTLYVTLEPCLMCAGALIHARVKRLVFGAPDPKAGAVMSQINILDQTFVNHRVEYSGGLLASECGKLLSEFFQKRRISKNNL